MTTTKNTKDPVSILSEALRVCRANGNRTVYEAAERGLAAFKAFATERAAIQPAGDYVKEEILLRIINKHCADWKSLENVPVKALLRLMHDAISAEQSRIAVAPSIQQPAGDELMRSHASIIVTNICAHAKAGHTMTGWLDDACTSAEILQKRLAAPVSAPVPEDVRVGSDWRRAIDRVIAVPVPEAAVSIAGAPARWTADRQGVVDHCWRMYQQGQISADHTAKEVFAEVLISFTEWLGVQVPEAKAEQVGESEIDAIVTALYRRFKDWSKRGFGPDDVTWCEVKADVVSLCKLATHAAPAVFPPTSEVKHEASELSARLSKLGDEAHEDIVKSDADWLKNIYKGKREAYHQAAELARQSAPSIQSQGADSKCQPIAVFEGYVDGQPLFKWTSDVRVSAGTKLCACPAPSIAVPMCSAGRADAVGRTIVGLRDGWATREDAAEALAILGLNHLGESERNIAVPAEEIEMLRREIHNLKRNAKEMDAAWRRIVAESTAVPAAGSIGDDAPYFRNDFESAAAANGLAQRDLRCGVGGAYVEGAAQIAWTFWKACVDARSPVAAAPTEAQQVELQIQAGFSNGLDLAQRFADARDAALEEAAMVCDGKFLKRAADRLPREASAARACRDEIRAMKSDAAASSGEKGASDA